MMLLEQQLARAVKDAFFTIFNQNIDEQPIQFQKTRKEFSGDITLVVFPFTKIIRKSPEIIAQSIGEYLKQHTTLVSNYNVIKGFLNIEITNTFWINYLHNFTVEQLMQECFVQSKKIMVEFSSPNTNKPLHLGHVRNNLLGNAIVNILKFVGNEVIKVNLVNDRGIHICKSMIAWKKYGNGETPETTGKKGDHLVGGYYVLFDTIYKKEVDELIKKGFTEQEAKKSAPILAEAQEMLRKWEAGDAETIELWKTMNNWVYQGFDITYNRLGISFDRIYYESDTYMLGKSIVLDGLQKGYLYRKEDGSVWADLTEFGLDHKVLLRSDGTSVYMTQDIGTAHQRFEEYNIDQHIYVVGNEQNYHFQALIAVFKKLGFSWADKIVHLSYGMVELPEGKMKSREGTVVDADDLLDSMIKTAKIMSEELGKLDGLSEEEKNDIVRIIGLGALKYFILKVDPKKNMIFDPKESIDFNGNTGPFIQYTHARIHSVLRKAKDMGIEVKQFDQSKLLHIHEKENILIQQLYQFSSVIAEAANDLNPAVIANYCYELAKNYNQFYHEIPILKEENDNYRSFKLHLSFTTATVLNQAMVLLGIEMPERM